MWGTVSGLVRGSFLFDSRSLLRCMRYTPVERQSVGLVCVSVLIDMGWLRLVGSLKL